MSGLLSSLRPAFLSVRLWYGRRQDAIDFCCSEEDRAAFTAAVSALLFQLFIFTRKQANISNSIHSSFHPQLQRHTKDATAITRLILQRQSKTQPWGFVIKGPVVTHVENNGLARSELVSTFGLERVAFFFFRHLYSAILLRCSMFSMRPSPQSGWAEARSEADPHQQCQR